MIPYLTDVAAFAVFSGVFGIYFLVARRRTHSAPHRTVQGTNQALRACWIRYVMGDPSRALQGVQTLRNSTMAATFFASTAVLLVIGTLNMTDQADRFASLWGGVAIPGSGHEIVWTAKVLLIVADLFAAFFAFAMSVRFFNHVGYQIAVPASDRPDWLTDDSVAELMNRAGGYYSVGMRAYFLAVPLVFWLFGPLFLVGVGAITLFLMISLERMTPSARDFSPPEEEKPSKSRRRGKD